MASTRVNNIALMSKIYIWFLLFLLLLGCGPKRLPPSDYIKWVENKANGLFIEKDINNYSFRLQFKPVEYIIAREFGPENLYKIDEFEARKNQLDSFCYFNLDISSADKKKSVLSEDLVEQKEYYSRLNYYTSFAQNDIKLCANGDTLSCSLYHFERTYDISPFNTIVLGFKLPCKLKDLNSDLQLIYEDKVLSVGEVKFLISKNKLQNIPQLAL